MSQELNNHLAYECRNRMRQLNVKGKKCADEALSFMVGAYAALQLVAAQRQDAEMKTDADHLARVLTMIVAVRGYSEIEKMANEHETAVMKLLQDTAAS